TIRRRSWWRVSSKSLGPLFGDVEREGHIFDVSYQTVDRELPDLIASYQPDALLMFGLAARTAHLRVETRARNAVSMLWPDASGAKLRTGQIEPGANARRFGSHTARLLRAALATGIDARSSRDAGRYLCNYLAFRAHQATTVAGDPALAAFIHVPLTARDGGAHPNGSITLEELVDAGEAMLVELIRLSRRARLAAALPA
ncbi:pyroglutamyl-peptidase I, partial [Rhodopseudomonas sp. B29]|uniref:pyroglutamyl-peptidase I family protein n=1 Tax=Rhodopseudomonas sp. B29 TaxID=95607 RepID=UPI0027D8F5CA